MVEVFPTQNAKIDLDKILNIRAFDLEKMIDLDPSFLQTEDTDHDDHHHDHDHEHTENCQHESHKKDHLDVNVQSVGKINSLILIVNIFSYCYGW